MIEAVHASSSQRRFALRQTDAKADSESRKRLPTPLTAAARATGMRSSVVAEALTNVVKHSQAGSAAVSARLQDDVLHIEVRDDGIGGAEPDGHGLVGMNDRVIALGGQLSVESPASGGTRVAATLPIASARRDI